MRDAANRQESVTAEDVKRMAQWALDLEAALRNVIDYLEGSDLSADHIKAKQLRSVTGRA